MGEDRKPFNFDAAVEKIEDELVRILVRANAGMGYRLAVESAQKTARTLRAAGYEKREGMVRLHKAAQQLIELKDGPRDSVYHSVKEAAWQQLRKALGVYDD